MVRAAFAVFARDTRFFLVLLAGVGINLSEEAEDAPTEAVGAATISAGSCCRDRAFENSCAILAKRAGNGCNSFTQSAAGSVPCVSTNWKRLPGVAASRCSIFLNAMSASRKWRSPQRWTSCRSLARV